jgi:hypothetical protein
LFFASQWLEKVLSTRATDNGSSTTPMHGVPKETSMGWQLHENTTILQNSLA